MCMAVDKKILLLVHATIYKSVIRCVLGRGGLLGWSLWSYSYTANTYSTLINYI